MFAIVVSAVTVVSVVAMVIYNTIAAKNVDIAYYEQEMYKYMSLLDAEVASKAKQLKEKDDVIEQKDVDMDYYEKEMYKYSDELNAEVASKDIDMIYYEQEMYKYRSLLNAEVASKAKELKEKDDMLVHQDVDLAYYEKEMYKYMTLLEAEVASRAKELNDKDTEIAYVDDLMKATIAAKNEELDYYRRRVNVLEETEMAY
jgi:hypothetical protein